MSTAAETKPERRAYGRLARVGMMWGGARVWSNELILVPTMMVLARLLSPGEFGVVAAAGLFAALIARVADFGFGAAIVRIRELRPEHTSSAFVVILAMNIGQWVALASAAPVIGAFFDSSETAAVIPVSALAFPISAFGAIPTALLTRHLRYREATVADLVSSVSGSVASVSLAWSGFGLWSLVYGNLLGTTVRAVMVTIMAQWPPSLRFSGAAVRELLSFGIGFQARNLLQWSSDQVDKVVVGRLLGLPALAFYDKACAAMTRFVSRINLAGPSVSFRIFSIIQDERERFRRAYRKVILGITLAGYPVLAGMAASAQQLFLIMFGTQWLPAVLPFQILCAAGMMRLLNAYASSATQAKGLVWSEVKRQATYTVLVALAAIAGSPWGITGVAFGVLAATAVMTCLMQTMVKRLTDLEWSDILAPQVPGALCAAGVVVAVSGVEYLVNAAFGAPPALVVFAVQCLAAGMLCVLFVFASGFPEVRGIVEETLNDLSPALAHRMKPFWPAWSSSPADRG